MKKEDDTLSELRQEYRGVKKELSRYDTFIDNHFAFCIFTPFALSLVAVVVAAVKSLAWVWVLALVLFAVFIIILTLSLVRAGRFGRINARLNSIEHEVKLFHSKSLPAVDPRNGRATSGGDELGLWQDIGSEERQSGKGAWVVGVIVIVAVASVISYNQANERKQEAAELDRQTQAIEQQRAKQQQDAIEQRKLDQQDEANRLQRQQNAIDLYNSTKPSTSRDDYSSSTRCTTNYYGGSTAYTNCY